MATLCHTDIYRIDLTITNWAEHIGYFVLHDTKNIVYCVKIVSKIYQKFISEVMLIGA